jgi:hypothetical protein
MLLSLTDSASPTVNGTGQVTRWRNPAASQLFTSEADYPSALVTGVTQIGTSAALPSLSAPADAWQVVLTCFAMGAFALFTILRRLRHQSRAHHRTPTRATH